MVIREPKGDGRLRRWLCIGATFAFVFSVLSLIREVSPAAALVTALAVVVVGVIPLRIEYLPIAKAYFNNVPSILRRSDR